MITKTKEQAREIRFRIRFGNGKKFKVVLYPLNNILQGQVKEFLDLNSDYKILSVDEGTGLKDKNGKEIFEGDILKRKFGRKKGEFNLYIVEQKEQRWAYPVGNLKGWSDIFKGDEVIGNIYENPELLEGK